MSPLRLAVFLTLPMVLAGAAGCRDTAVVTAAYATLGDAEAAGAISRGWIPAGLPPGAHDLREAHDERSARRWGLFSFPPAQGDDLRRLLAPDEESFAGWRCDIPPRIEWWPVSLRGALHDEKLKATGLRAYRSRSGELLFAVNWNQGRAYYWAPDARGAR